jgi:hypothetical protein
MEGGSCGLFKGAALAVAWKDWGKQTSIGNTVPRLRIESMTSQIWKIIFNPLATFFSSSWKKTKQGKVVLVLDQIPYHEDVWQSGGITPRILHLGIRWKWVVSFMLGLLYPQGKSPCYPYDRRMGEQQSWSGCGGEEKRNPFPSGNQTPVVQLMV